MPFQELSFWEIVALFSVTFMLIVTIVVIIMIGFYDWYNRYKRRK